MQDFSYVFSDESFADGAGPENNIWNNNSNMWVDGDFILDGKSIIYNIGELSINNTIIGTIINAASINKPWKKSVQQTALKPPSKV